MARKLSAETRERMRQAKLGKPRKPFSEQHRLALSVATSTPMANTELRQRIAAGVSAARRRVQREAAIDGGCAIPVTSLISQPPVSGMRNEDREAQPSSFTDQPYQPRIIPLEEMTPSELERWCETGIQPYR